MKDFGLVPLVLDIAVTYWEESPSLQEYAIHGNLI